MATSVQGERRVYQPPISDEILELAEAAKFARLSESTLVRSDCPRSKVGGRILFLRSQLLLWVAVRLTHFIEAPAS